MYKEVVLHKSEQTTIILPDGRQVVVMFCGHRSRAAQIGIKAPSDVSVDRAEVHEQKQDKRHGT